eukprot:5950982-Pleurochrysis_carterae.AAC.4
MHRSRVHHAKEIPYGTHKGPVLLRTPVSKYAVRKLEIAAARFDVRSYIRYGRMLGFLLSCNSARSAALPPRPTGAQAMFMERAQVDASGGCVRAFVRVLGVRVRACVLSVGVRACMHARVRACVNACGGAFVRASERERVSACELSAKLAPRVCSTVAAVVTDAISSGDAAVEAQPALALVPVRARHPASLWETRGKRHC